MRFISYECPNKIGTLMTTIINCSTRALSADQKLKLT